MSDAWPRGVFIPSLRSSLYFISVPLLSKRMGYTLPWATFLKRVYVFVCASCVGDDVAPGQYRSTLRSLYFSPSSGVIILIPCPGFVSCGSFVVPRSIVIRLPSEAVRVCRA